MSDSWIVMVYDDDLPKPPDTEGMFPIVVTPDTGFYGPFDYSEALTRAESIDLPTQVISLSGWPF